MLRLSDRTTGCAKENKLASGVDDDATGLASSRIQVYRTVGPFLRKSRLIVPFDIG